MDHVMLRDCLWLLDESDDHRLMCEVILARDGFEVVPFENVTRLLQFRPPVAPTLAVIDAWSARSHEQATAALIPGERLLVTATTRHHEEMWRALGASMVLLKPYRVDVFRASVRALALPVGP
jgi:DNA-binding NtrC family response regulator